MVAGLHIMSHVLLVIKVYQVVAGFGWIESDPSLTSIRSILRKLCETPSQFL